MHAHAVNTPTTDFYLGVADPARLPTIANALVDRSCIFVSTVTGRVLSRPSVLFFVALGGYDSLSFSCTQSEKNIGMALFPRLA